MNTIFKPLAEMDFAGIIRESYAETQTGKALLDSYRRYLLTNESSCTIVNRFLNEAKNCMYDSGVVAAVNEISGIINESRVSWQLATACEAINMNRSSYNYLNRNAASTVEKLLEQDEENVVKYIKAGALKNVMFCEAFRNIVNGVFTDCQRIVTEDYTATRPVSYVEESEGKQYFEVLGNIYSIEGNEIHEAKASEVSGDFLYISRLLESNNANFDANAEKLVVETPLAVYEVYVEEGDTKCKRTSKPKNCDGKDCKDKETNESIVFENEQQLREHNRLVVGASSYKFRAQTAELLESIAKAFEHFENFMLLDNVQIIETKNDKFVVIENKENAFAYLINSNHSSGWKLNTTIVEALKFIEKQTSINLNKDYKENIDEQIKKTEEEKAQEIVEDVKRSEMIARKQKIEMLTEKFKNDPATLAVLSKVAETLNKEQ